ncbi:hypothetical protein [Desulfonema limicola]|uniref:ParE family toxin-like protein n=1 Tax=Desulfonema limicola TaxID=45656 RepID=UPI001A9BC8A5|nr:hypothetical protein [Desulfonema limicola]
MNSFTLKSFWDEYYKLDSQIKKQVKKSYGLWIENPFHPSLRFKCINQSEKIWAVRVSLEYRALGVMDGDIITWFWIGRHDKYESFFG